MERKELKKRKIERKELKERNRGKEILKTERLWQACTQVG